MALIFSPSIRMSAMTVSEAETNVPDFINVFFVMGKALPETDMDHRGWQVG
jgi:hypothetical protein